MSLTTPNHSADPVRFGLIGYGAWGAHHARAIRQASGAELVAIAARSDSSQAAARLDCTGLFVLPRLPETNGQELID